VELLRRHMPSCAAEQDFDRRSFTTVDVTPVNGVCYTTALDTHIVLSEKLYDFLRVSRRHE
jgi:hypothetical protein